MRRRPDYGAVLRDAFNRWLFAAVADGAAVTQADCERARLPPEVTSALLAAQDAGAHCAASPYPCDWGGAHANADRVPPALWPRMLAAGFRQHHQAPWAMHWCEGESRRGRQREFLSSPEGRLAAAEAQALAFLAHVAERDGAGQPDDLAPMHDDRLAYLAGVVAGLRLAQRPMVVPPQTSHDDEGSDDDHGSD